MEMAAGFMQLGFGVYEKPGNRVFIKECRDRRRGDGLKLEAGRIPRLLGYWEEILLCEAAFIHQREAQSLAPLEGRLGRGDLSNLLHWKLSLMTAGDWMIFKIPSNQSI